MYAAEAMQRGIHVKLPIFVAVPHLLVVPNARLEHVPMNEAPGVAAILMDQPIDTERHAGMPGSLLRAE